MLRTTRPPRDPDGVPSQPISRLELAGILAVVVAGFGLRLLTRSDLWLDEALSVHIARLPLDEVVDALRRDGHPPLYYLTLHGWMSLVGEGDVAVRSLSLVCNVLTLPLVWMLGARRRGPTAGWAAVLVFAILPFAVRYGSEARMYALLALLVAIGWLLVDAVLDEGAGWWAVGGIAVVGSALLYTHYWSMWLLAALGLALIAHAWRTDDPARRRGSLRAIGALVVAGVTFLPWVPILLDQQAHTGTPWGERQRPSMSLAVALIDFAGGGLASEAVLGAVVLAVLVGLALLARSAPPDRIVLHLRGVQGIRAGAVTATLALLIGITVAWATGATFASRYASIVLPVVVVAAGLGLVTMPTRWVRIGVAVVVAGTFGVSALAGALDERTQGGEAARALGSLADPDDVVVVCPDQLGPAFSHHLRTDVTVLTHPSLEGPDRVDWWDYEERNAQGDPHATAAAALERAGDGSSVWLVWNGGYATYGTQCEELRNALAAERPPATVVIARPDEVFEPMWLERFAPAS